MTAVVVLTFEWNNPVSYSDGYEVEAFADRTLAVTRVRELWTDLGLHTDRADTDGDPDTDDNGYWSVPYEGHLSWQIHTVELKQSHVCDSDGRDETHTLCSVCGTCDNGI